MKRISLAVLAAAVAGLVVASSALADPPTRDPAASDPLRFDAGLVCPFPLLLEATDNRQVITTFSNGRVLITGQFKSRVTNLASGESIEVNAPGPIRVEQNADGTWHVQGTGSTLFFFFPGNLGPGRPGALLFLHGKTDETLTPAMDDILSFSHVGTTENLCDTLA